MKRILTILLAAGLGAAAMMAGEPATAVFSVEPPMSCQNCENKIKSNLRFEKGVKSIATSLDNQTVTVVYDPAKTSPEQIVKGFARIGYKAVQSKAPAAKAKKAPAGLTVSADTVVVVKGARKDQVKKSAAAGTKAVKTDKVKRTATPATPKKEKK